MITNIRGKLKLSQLMIVLYFICHGSLLGATTNAMFIFSREDSWMVPILSSIIGFIPFYLSIHLMNKFPDQNIFEIIESQFGKIMGKIINIILIGFISSYAMIFFWNLTNFISSQHLYNTPQTFIAILFTIPITYLLSKGIQVILRSSTIIFFLSFIFFSITAVALIPQIQISNIFPIMADGIISPFKSLFAAIGYLVLPLFMITCIPKKSFEKHEHFSKNMILAYFLVQLTIILIVFCILSIFGIELTLLYQYPEFQILRRVSLGGFIERVESTLSIQWILDLLMMITFICYFIKVGISHIFQLKEKKRNHWILNTVIIIILLISLFIFPDNTSANSFLIKTYPIYCYIILLGIPIFIFVKSLFMKKKNT